MTYNFDNLTGNIKKWFGLKKDEVITLNRYKKIIVEWDEIKSKRKNGEISKEESRERAEKLLEEVNKCALVFNNDLEFCTFCENFYKDPAKAKKTIKHEIDHAQVYRDAKIPCEIGFHKFWSEEKNDFCYMPYVEDFARLDKNLDEEDQKSLHKKSLENVDRMSEFDKRAYEKLN